MRAEPGVLLREVLDEDLSLFFEQQTDPLAVRMAAFTTKDPTDRIAFVGHWTRIRSDESVVIRTIVSEDQVAGYVLKHEAFGDPEISYWIGREFWGRGVATRSLAAFVEQVKIRPLLARVAKDNQASIRVLEKCGFVRTGEDRGFANARGEEIDELIFNLD